MRGSAAKDFRRQVNAAARQAAKVTEPMFNAVVLNQRLCTERVEFLKNTVQKNEQRVDVLAGHVQALLGFRSSTFRGRLRWLLLGR